MSKTISLDNRKRLILEEFKLSGAETESNIFVELFDILVEKLDTGMTAEVIGKRGTKAHKTYIEKNGYFALHHILPKSIFEKYAREAWNLVYLTADEHIKVHKLLAQIYLDGSVESSKMKSAYHLMIKSENRTLDIHIDYPKAKRDLALEFYKTPRGLEYKKQIAEMSKEFNSTYWKSDEGIATREEFSKRMSGSGNPCYGKTGDSSLSNKFIYVAYTEDLSLIDYFYGQNEAQNKMLEKYGVKVSNSTIRACTVVNHLNPSGYNRSYCGKYLGKNIKWKKIEKEYFLNEPSYFLSGKFLIN